MCALMTSADFFQYNFLETKTKSAAKYRSSFAQHFVELNLGSNYLKMLSTDYENRYSRENIEYLSDFLTSLILTVFKINLSVLYTLILHLNLNDFPYKDNQ